MSEREEDDLDEALEQTFPASDPPANTVETGIGIALQPGDVVYDNREAGRFEITVDGELAFLQYDRKPGEIVLVHTEVPPSLRGRHIGDVLVGAGLTAARAEGLRVIAVCPFVRAYLRKHQE